MKDTSEQVGKVLVFNEKGCGI